MNKFKSEIDDILIPKSNLEPLTITMKGLNEKRLKERREARIFGILQFVIISLIILLSAVSIKWILWIQIPATAVALISLVNTFRKGAANGRV